MNLQAPAAAWLALAIPAILALWILRPRRTRVRASSLLLWRGAEVERQSARPWQRLRSHPLLWLQLLVALLLVAAAMRPFLPASAEAQHVVVLLDASGSMRATDAGPDRFAVARDRVEELAHSLGPGQRLSLIRVDGAPSVLATNASPGEIERLLPAQQPAYGAPDFEAAFALAEGIAPGPAEWVLVTDGALDLPASARLPAGSSLRTVLVSPETPGGNVAVTGLRVRLEGAQVSVQAGIHNTGTSIAAGELVLASAGTIVGAQDWSLEPGAEQFLTWTGLPAGDGWFEAWLTNLPPAANALAHDDRAWAGTAPSAERRVLLVSEGHTFLERVFTVLGGIRADRAAPDQWEAILATGDPYDIVVFDGAWPETPPAGNVLRIAHPSAERFRPERIDPDPAHPLMRYVDWSEVSIGGAYALPLDDRWQTVVGSPGGALVATLEEGGRREAAIAFDLSESDLALRPAFPVLIANVLEWLAPRGAGEPIATVPGDPVRIDALPLVDAIRVEGPDGVLDNLAPPWPPTVFRAPEPGLYRVVQSGASGEEEQLLIASGFVPSEASLERRPITVEGEGGPAAAGLPELARSLWPWLAVLVIGVSLTEWWWDARRR